MRPLERVDAEEYNPSGWGSVPAQDGDIATVTPAPADPTAPTPTTAQQNATATTTAVVQQTLLPPPPPPNACILNNAFSPAFYTWLIQLQRRVGGFSADPLSDTSLVLDAFANDSAPAPATAELDMDVRMVPVAELADYSFPEMPGGDHLTTWNDWNASISSAKVPAASAPAWNALVGNLYAFQFAVNDYIYMEAQEFLHDWKEGTNVQIHLHWVTGGLNDATVRGVKWEVEYSVCNPVEGAFGATAFTTTTTVSSEASIPAAQPDRTHRITSIAMIPGTNLRIGAQIVMRLRRIAATATAPAANPFGISFGLHYESDTPGSRSIATK